MGNTVTPTGPVPEISLEASHDYRSKKQAEDIERAEARRHPPPPNPVDQSQFRLIIEEDEATGAFVYKKLDRATGEVVLQFPREEVLKLRDQVGYRAGAIIRATA